MSQRALPKRGFVLLWTLALVSLASICLAGLARYSLQLAVSAQQAQEDLQRRWGTASCRRVLLQQADSILQAQVPRDQWDLPPWPKPGRRTAAFMLGDLLFTVTLADEDAKVNLNSIFRKKREALLPIIHELTRDKHGMATLVHLSPQIDSPTPFESWGQILDLANTLTDTNAAQLQLMEVGQELTCWGSGRLNLHRANDAAVREIAKIAVSADKVGKLLELRKSWGGTSIDELLTQLDLRRTQQAALKRLVAAESQCFSLWIRAENGQRSWSTLLVDEGSAALVSFVW